MKCQACAYEFDPARGLTCPRCGETLDCTAVDCGSCGACSGVLAGLARRLAGPGPVDEGADGS